MFDFESVFYVAHSLVEAAGCWNSLIMASTSDLQEPLFACLILQSVNTRLKYSCITRKEIV